VTRSIVLRELFVWSKRNLSDEWSIRKWQRIDAGSAIRSWVPGRAAQVFRWWVKSRLRRLIY